MSFLNYQESGDQVEEMERGGVEGGRDGTLNNSREAMQQLSDR